jgi:hypothetical protein
MNNPSPKINVCLYGYGIVCGLTVHVNEDCEIELGSGTAIASNGTLIHIDKKKFSCYFRTPSSAVLDYFPHDFKDDKKRVNRTVLELVPSGGYNASLMDSFKPQHAHDLPTRDMLKNKTLVVLTPKDRPNEPHFVLVSPSILVEKKGNAFKQAVKELPESTVKESHSGLFSRQKPKVDYNSESIEKVLYPYLQLPDVLIPRFGYKILAKKKKNESLSEDNIENPLLKIKSFKQIFDEYKAILDELIPDFVSALENLHTLYGDGLTHKGKDYWLQFHRILEEKWCSFLEEGEHLYYIQYFYDWLTDMVKAYEELREHLTAFVGVCSCDETHADDSQEKYTLIQLGPVLGGRTSYTPTLFRDYFQPPMVDGNNENKWREIQFLHWRLMMMIWTFDLPQLKLDEKVLIKKGYLVYADEFKDSTNYFEKTNTVDLASEKEVTVNLEDVPIKFTPSQTPDTLISEQAIPYYYPLDANSPYSIHRFWNYRLTQLKQLHKIRSFNAFEGCDSYAFISKNIIDKNYHKDALYPLAFNLRNYPFLRAEGHIGKLIQITKLGTSTNVRLIDTIKAIIDKYNLTVNVVLVSTAAVGGLKDFIAKNQLSVANPNASLGVGLEHIGGLEQGQTLVLVYAAAKEDIVIEECKKPIDEIEENTIVADFTIPMFFTK